MRRLEEEIKAEQLAIQKLLEKEAANATARRPKISRTIPVPVPGEDLAKVTGTDERKKEAPRRRRSR